MIYTYFWDKVYIWYIVKNIELNTKFTSLDLLQDYEKIVSKDERDSKDITYWNDYMREKTYDKSIKQYVNFHRWSNERQIDEVKRYLKNSPDKKFFIDDSIEVWNCLPWTQWFIEQYQIHEGITWEELLKHKRFENMIENSRFRNVVLNKISIELD